MAKNENAQNEYDAMTLHERAVEHARDDVAGHPALCTTDERVRPVAVTSTHETLARAGVGQYAVTVVRGRGQRSVVRVLATDDADAVRHAAVACDVEPHELVVDVVERESPAPVGASATEVQAD